MIFNKSKSIVALGLTGLALVAGTANAALFLDFGNTGVAGAQLNRTIAASTVSVTGVGEGSSFATGSFTTIGGPITFQLDISATDGDIIGQDEAFGVNGGSAVVGIDNGNGTGAQESMTFTISNFANLGAGETLEITSISVLFGSTSEAFTINGGSNTNFTSNSGGGNAAEVITVSGTSVTIAAGSTPATAFGIDGITVAVVTIPESSTALLGGLGILLTLRRRRS